MINVVSMVSEKKVIYSVYVVIITSYFIIIILPEELQQDAQ